MERLQRMFGGAGGSLVTLPKIHQLSIPPSKSTSLHYISSLALLKMLNTTRSVMVPMEVMGLKLGEFVSEYTVCVIDVVAMPQSETDVISHTRDPLRELRKIPKFTTLVEIKKSDP